MTKARKGKPYMGACMFQKQWHDDYEWCEGCATEPRTMQIEDAPLMQPIGFIWTYRPRYRVQAQSRKVTTQR